MHFHIEVAHKGHTNYAASICKMMEEAAKVRGTGIAKRQPEYLQSKMKEGKAVIALDKDQVIGFCYIESWEGAKYVANSGLIVHPDYRKTGLAKAIKNSIFKLSLEKFPDSKLFGITTSMAVMKINSDLGYQPVAFSELTKDQQFWEGCKSCPNYDILKRTEQKMCLCTGMVCDLSKVKQLNQQQKKNSWEKFKRFLQLKNLKLKRRNAVFMNHLKLKLK